MLLDFLEFVGAVPFGWTKSLWGDTANGYYNRYVRADYSV